MPLKVTCDCGQVLSVPETAAGKKVKCPKCQKAIDVPATSAAAPATAIAKAGATTKSAPAKATVAATSSAAPAMPAKPAARPAATAAAGMDDLFDEAGLKKKSGPVCPKCGASISKLAAICTKCGFNLQSGEQLQGLKLKTQEEDEFKNEHLQDAANNMVRDNLAEERHAKAGMPWWMVVAFLFGALCIGTAGVLIVDTLTNEPQAESTFIGKVQRQKIPVVIGTTFILMSAFMSTLANLSILIFAFQQSIGRGFACMFIPFYIFIYGCITWVDNKAAIKGILIAAAIGGFGAYLYFAGGGIKI